MRLSGRCSVASAEVGEPLAGTAVDEVHTWLLLEVGELWAPKAIQTEALGADVRACIESWLEATPGARLQLVRRPGRRGRRSLKLVDTRSRSVAECELDRYQAILDLDFDAMIAAATPLADSIYLVCAHGRRDRCCAEHGSAVFRALFKKGVDVWQTSHLGGHRFAACALWLPDGLMYGRLRNEHVDDWVVAHTARRVGALERFRGRCAFDRPTQAAEIFLREKLGEDGIDALRWLGTEASQGVWAVRFEVGDQPHTIRVSRQESTQLRPASCGGAPEPFASFTALD